MKKGALVAQDVFELFELPPEAAGAAKTQIIRDREVLIENHRGLIEYGDALISVASQDGVISIRGSMLRVRAMTERRIRITGKIDCVEFGSYA